MKKIISLLLSFVLIIFSITACGSNSNTSKDEKVYQIGIGQFAEHPSLDNCRYGFMEGLKDNGFVEGKNVKFLYENAQTDGGFCAQINNNFVSKKMDMIVAIATPIAQSAYAATQGNNIPVIFTAVTDPIAAGIANSDGTPVGNITGTSDKLPVEEQLKLIREMYPEATKLGILYTTSEVNSVSSIEEYKKIAPNYNFNIITRGVSQTSEISLATDNILNEIDVMTNLTDNTVVASLPLILEKANVKNIPVFGSEIEQVKMGCIACVGLDYFELGKQTANIASRILKGEDIKNINYEIIQEAARYINTKVCENLNCNITDEMISAAKEVFNTIEG